LIGLTLLALLVGAAFEVETRVVRGWLGGEEFFQGRPTSWWREVMVREVDPPPSRLRGTSLEWIIDLRDNDRSLSLTCDLAADDVLRALMKDQNPRVAGFARRVLGLPRQKEIERGHLEALATQHSFLRIRMKIIGDPNNDVD
jgi:hypothetical protein